jgi:hypothetical protein
LPSARRSAMAVVVSIGVITTTALVPYFYLVSHRPATLDEQQTMLLTHAPDLLRAHEILGTAILVALVIGIRRGKIEKNDPLVIYAASLGLLPFVVFNQQILTGRMMQVFHYEIFVVNYSTLVGILILAAIFWKPVPRRLLRWVACLSLGWGFIVVALPARLVFVPLASVDDQSIPVLIRLKELSKQDGTVADLRVKGQTSNLVFSSSVSVTALLPTWTSQGTLLDTGGVDFGSVTREERKQFFYMHLYYSNADPETLRRALNGGEDNSTIGRYARSMMFGHERITPALSPDFKPIREDEVNQEVRAYEAYSNSFSRLEVIKRPITYAVVPADASFDFVSLDRWYERDAGERVGAQMLYRLKLRN